MSHLHYLVQPHLSASNVFENVCPILEKLDLSLMGYLEMDDITELLRYRWAECEPDGTADVLEGDGILDIVMPGGTHETWTTGRGRPEDHIMSSRSPL